MGIFKCTHFVIRWRQCAIRKLNGFTDLRLEADFSSAWVPALGNTLKVTKDIIRTWRKLKKSLRGLVKGVVNMHGSEQFVWGESITIVWLLSARKISGNPIWN